MNTATVFTMTNERKDVTTWTPQQAAQDTGVSRSTIMRMITRGELPNAEKIDGKWAIPVTDLGAAGLSPGQPTPPDDQHDQSSDQTTDRTPDQTTELALLTAQLEAERARRQAAEQVSNERLARIEDLHQALADLRLALPAPPKDDEQSTAESAPAESVPQETFSPPETSKRPGFLRRLFDRF